MEVLPPGGPADLALQASWQRQEARPDPRPFPNPLPARHLDNPAARNRWRCRPAVAHRGSHGRSPHATGPPGQPACSACPAANPHRRPDRGTPPATSRAGQPAPGTAAGTIGRGAYQVTLHVPQQPVRCPRVGKIGNSNALHKPNRRRVNPANPRSPPDPRPGPAIHGPRRRFKVRPGTSAGCFARSWARVHACSGQRHPCLGECRGRNG